MIWFNNLLILVLSYFIFHYFHIRVATAYFIYGV